jgi:hypothetical protein
MGMHMCCSSSSDDIGRELKAQWNVFKAARGDKVPAIQSLEQV